jgi:hypothetical protein
MKVTADNQYHKSISQPNPQFGECPLWVDAVEKGVESWAA